MSRLRVECKFVYERGMGYAQKPCSLTRAEHADDSNFEPGLKHPFCDNEDAFDLWRDGEWFEALKPGDYGVNA